MSLILDGPLALLTYLGFSLGVYGGWHHDWKIVICGAILVGLSMLVDFIVDLLDGMLGKVLLIAAAVGLPFAGTIWYGFTHWL